jgi:hypothetical protein
MTIWLHIYIVHYCAWFSALVLLEVHTHGLPKHIMRVVCPALLLSFVMAFISSHGHMHYLQFFQ